MPYAKYRPQEVESMGEAIFERLRARVGPGNRGRFMVIDVESGEYEIDDDDLTATQRFLAKRPDGVFYGLRIGYAAAYRLGGHSSVDPR